ncbi:hypothetical protein C427_2636 [Paraglaciecola psychrophila 170]|uniref:Uncharacterized protein n=1 Tax=Paraglaciecola psychrophila 170 TaxID=1129794 RepID=K6ZPB2_9ALTE|nr:hypothetical protein C427_2636 [Paraglaciecola psychrophila 170]GAC37781.1 hypothetical protein GPSY_2159 [Paraglaciecola psychrophila 170]
MITDDLILASSKNDIFANFSDLWFLYLTYEKIVNNHQIKHAAQGVYIVLSVIQLRVFIGG